MILFGGPVWPEEDSVEEWDSPHLITCHAKDIKLHGQLNVHLDEGLLGQGFLNYPTFLRELHKLPGHIPLLLEHLPDEAVYKQAAANLRAVAQAVDILL